MSEAARVQEAAAALAHRGVERVALGMVLGSGLKRFGERVERAQEIPFSDVPHWPVPQVAGHGGNLVVGEVAGLRVACLTGRVHLYEGWQPAEVVRAVRTLALLGTPRLVITNAAGGIDPTFHPGDLMLIRDHINRTGTSALVGPHQPELGPRFPDQSRVYDVELAEVLRSVDPALKAGTYVGNLGPAYETPAEIQMLNRAGAHAVGMSTVLEAAAASAMGVRIAGITLVSNLAAGIAQQPLSHDEVIEEGRRAEGRLTALLEGFCARLARRDG